MKTYKLIITALCALALAACGAMQQAKSPTETLKSFVEASKKKDTAEMKKMLSKDSLKLIEKTAQEQKITVDDLLKMDDKSSLKETPETREEKIEGDRASVEAKNPITGGYDKILLVKEDGVWKIDLDTMMKDMYKKMTEQMNKPPVTAAPNSNTASPSANSNSGNTNSAGNK